MKKRTSFLIGILSVMLTAVILLSSLMTAASAQTVDRLLGDVDNDNSVTVLDSTAVQKSLAFMITLDNNSKFAADVDADGFMTVIDATAIQKWLAHYEISYPIGEPIVIEDPTQPEETQPEETQPPYTIPPYTANEFEDEVIRLTNEQRAENGLPALKKNNDLCYLAHLKSQDMHDKLYFDHTSPTYGDPFEMMDDFGVSFWYAGENIAAGQRTPQAVVTAWMNSPGHRANILTKEFKEIGVGCYQGENGFKIYWTQMFIG